MRHAGLDPKFAKSETIVGAKLDHGTGQKRQPLPPSVLEQVSGEFSDQRVLVLGQPLAVPGRQVDQVLVWHVSP